MVPAKKHRHYLYSQKVIKLDLWARSSYVDRFWSEIHEIMELIMEKLIVGLTLSAVAFGTAAEIALLYWITFSTNHPTAFWRSIRLHSKPKDFYNPGHKPQDKIPIIFLMQQLCGKSAPSFSNEINLVVRRK